VAARRLKHWREGKNPRHVGYVERRIKAHILPAIGDRPIPEIEAPELVAMVQAIQASDFRPGDVLRSLPAVNRARVGAKELPQLMQAIEAYPGRHATRLALKLMALCFVRTGELLGARWEEFDIEARRWDIPAARMKMKSPLIVPLASQTLEVLEVLRTMTGAGPLLFPGDVDPRKPLSSNTILRALEQLGFKGRMTGHGFRGILSTVLHEQVYNHDWVEIQLAHLPANKVSAAYNHAAYLQPRAAMMQSWADFITGTEQSGKVLLFRKEGAA
jgi:integrase